MTVNYDYYFEDSDLGVTEVSEAEAEAMRRGEWSEDFPEIESARGIGQNGKPGRLTRVPKCA